MTTAELAEKLRALHNNFDIEVAHIRADDLLMEFFKAIDGGTEVVEAFSALTKWYA